MERPVNPRNEHLKEIGWAVLVIDVAIAVRAAFLVPQVGMRAAAWVFVGFAGLVTTVIGGLLAVNLVGVWVYERWERRIGRAEDR